MKIRDILNKGDVTISMEVFPPKTEEAFPSVRENVRAIARLNPSFISCTYGAGGGTRRYTIEINELIMEEGVTSMAHMTCINSTRADARDQIRKIRDAGIENVLALRGDIPEGMDFPNPRYFEHADQLIAEIRDEYPDVCIGGACYPEKHPDSRTKDEDIAHIKNKVDAGLDFLTTQMFFDNSIFYNYLFRLRDAGVQVPVLAGIMPITSRQQIVRSVQLSGCIVPPELMAMADRFGDNPQAMKQAGILYASNQILDLLANGIKHIHIYTMNKPDVVEGILNNIKGLI